MMARDLVAKQVVIGIASRKQVSHQVEHIVARHAVQSSVWHHRNA